MSDPKIRVLHVINRLRRGGAEVMLLELHRYLDPHFFDVHYCCIMGESDSVTVRLRDAGAVVSELLCAGVWDFVLAVRRLRRIVRLELIDIVHAHLPLAGVFVRLACLGLPVKVVYSEHSLSDLHSFKLRLANRVTWLLNDHVVAVSNDVRDSVARSYGKSIPIAVIPNGVDTERFSRSGFSRDLERSAYLPKSSAMPANAFVVGTVVNMRSSPAKRLDLWMDTLVRLMRARANVYALIVGDGALRPCLEQRVRASGVYNRFIFAGAADDVRPYLAAMDVFLSTSRYEGLPVAVLEAMAFGLPVVVPDSRGLREVVVDGKTGLVAKAKDDLSCCIVDLLCRFVDSLQLTASLGAGAEEHVARNFSLQSTWRKTAALYSRLAFRTQG